MKIFINNICSLILYDSKVKKILKSLKVKDRIYIDKIQIDEILIPDKLKPKIEIYSQINSLFIGAHIEISKKKITTNFEDVEYDDDGKTLRKILYHFKKAIEIQRKFFN